MTDPNRGYLRERFPDLKGNSFNCGICNLVCKDPKECEKCGATFCTYCIDERISIKNECPAGCADAKTNIKPITGALAKIYRNIDVHCKYPDCKRIVKLCELAQHEAICQLPKCQFFRACGNYLKASNVASGVCDPACGFLKAVEEANGNWETVYESIKNFLQSAKITKSSPCLKDSNSTTDFRWDAEKIGHNVQLTNERRTIFLHDNTFGFRSVVSDKPMFGGVHYWEIHADSRTEYEIKVGVSLTAEFDQDTCFSDQEFGFAYYGLGQLRNGSNSNGASFGKRFRREGVLGVCLNMNKGTLSFALNGEYIGRAFKADALKRGPIYPAVSILRLAGCTLVTGKPVPDYFTSQ